MGTHTIKIYTGANCSKNGELMFSVDVKHHVYLLPFHAYRECSLSPLFVECATTLGLVLFQTVAVHSVANTSVCVI